MKHYFTAFLSLAVISQTLGVLADDAVDCYAIDAVNETSLTFNSLNLCASHCGEAGYSVFAARGSLCSCLHTLPPNDKKRDASQCNVACPGYALENCGGLAGNYSVGTIEGLGIDSSSTASLSVSTTGPATTTTVSGGSTASSITSLQTTPGAATASSSSTPLNSTVIATPSSTSVSSGSASSTVESSSVGAPIFRKGATAMASIVSVVAALVALI
ncbi:uncharacterized protein LA080_014935 [Diaporthe eres]|nr:uncharacterized protein LA080_014935 [Diaporthe eres]